jgi:myo-inositol-1(or 4)-monophosphatase
MNAPLLKKRAKSERDAAAEGWRDLDWERLSHADTLVGAIVETTQTAGDLALGFFRAGEKTSAAVSRKAGGSPVTEADHVVNRHLEERLRAILPDAGWLSEESTDSPERLTRDLVFVIDPIDGTRNFAAGEPTWAVSVAVVYRRRPIIGVIHAPVLGETYVAVRNAGARLNGREIHVSDRTQLGAGARISGPFAMAQELRGAGLEFDLLPKISALAVRIAKVAAGALDAALVSANSHDWDIAAADLILEEAGGWLASLHGREIQYNRTGTWHGELVAGPEPVLAELSAAARRARAS